MYRRLLYIPILLCPLYSSAQRVEKASEKNKQLEIRVLKKVENLPEVKQEEKQVFKLSDGKRHITETIYRRPDKAIDFYWVKVWEDNGNNCATHFNFMVDPNTWQIMYYDVMHDTLIEYTKWSNARKEGKVSH